MNDRGVDVPAAAPPSPASAAARGDGGRGLSIAWFLIMLAAWAIVTALLVASPDTVDRFWQWSRDLPLWLKAVEWIILLPWMIGIAIWQSDWANSARIAAIALVACGWILASKP